jgi:hypothetical protein
VVRTTGVRVAVSVDVAMAALMVAPEAPDTMTVGSVWVLEQRRARPWVGRPQLLALSIRSMPTPPAERQLPA